MWSCFLLLLLHTSLPDMHTMNKFTTKVTHSMNSDQKSSFMIRSFMTSDQKSSFIIRSLMTSDQKSPFRLRSFMTSDQKSRIGKPLMTSERCLAGTSSPSSLHIVAVQLSPGTPSVVLLASSDCRLTVCAKSLLFFCL